MSEKKIGILIRDDLRKKAEKLHIALDDITLKNYICAYFQEEDIYGDLTFEDIKRLHSEEEQEVAVNYMLERDIACRE